MPDAAADLSLDVLIVGGGIAGLWLIDELRRAGYSALLVENRALGNGQTVWSQGIIHGGLKYTLSGMLSPAAEAIREMPGVWRSCLAGVREPDLSGATIRTNHCHLWQTESVMSRLGMIGARVGLRVAPIALDPVDRPDVLKCCPGTVARLDEQVIDPNSVLRVLASRNAASCVLARDGELEWTRLADESPAATLRTPGKPAIRLLPGCVVLAAGGGNGALRGLLGLDPSRMQIRPLQMVLLRGNTLPSLFGHCVDGARTRVTITSATDAEKRTVWQVGGQLAEDGVGMSPVDLIHRARAELRACLPGVSLDGCEWSTYVADRAELATDSRRRPEDATILVEGRVITSWPTKLALAPRLTDLVLGALREQFSHLRPESGVARDRLSHVPWDAPAVASAPWEDPRDWLRITENS